MPFTLPPLPYAPTALEPHMSAKTLALHHGKHHRGYVTNLNELVARTPFEGMALEDVVRTAHATAATQALFNNAAQHWNHSMFWQSMKPGGGGPVPDALEKRLIARFGSVATFKTEFTAQGMAQFGSGWVWLVEKDGDLQIQRTANALSPLVDGVKPLLVCDVWEHAYYVDYENRRADFLGVFLEHLVDWDAVLDERVSRPLAA